MILKSLINREKGWGDASLVYQVEIKRTGRSRRPQSFDIFLGSRISRLDRFGGMGKSIAFSA